MTNLSLSKALLVLFLHLSTHVLAQYYEETTVSFAQPPAHSHSSQISPAEPPKTNIHHHHNNNNSKKIHPPAQAPIIRKQYPPAAAPTKSNPFPRSFVAVEGVVYCKSCKYIGVDTLASATPLQGASVKLECNNTNKAALLMEAKTDKNGYFLINGPKSLTTYGSHKCKVSLLSSPIATCNKTTDFHAGHVGALLMPHLPRVMLPRTMPVELFTVGPFAFEPSTKCT